MNLIRKLLGAAQWLIATPSHSLGEAGCAVAIALALVGICFWTALEFCSCSRHLWQLECSSFALHLQSSPEDSKLLAGFPSLLAPFRIRMLTSQLSPCCVYLCMYLCKKKWGQKDHQYYRGMWILPFQVLCLDCNMFFAPPNFALSLINFNFHAITWAEQLTNALARSLLLGLHTSQTYTTIQWASWPKVGINSSFNFLEFILVFHISSQSLCRLGPFLPQSHPISPWYILTPSHHHFLFIYFWFHFISTSSL